MNLVKEFLLLKAKVDKLYCQLIAKSPDEQDPTVPNHVKTIKQEDIDNWNNVKEEKVQITEDTAFTQIGQTQKDFNKSVSDYKIDSDLKNSEQDERLENLEGINYTWSPTNRTLTLFDSNGTQLSQVSLVSLDNEGTDIRYNASTLSLELYNADNELLDSIPVSSFIGSIGTQLQLNSNQLQLKDSQGNILSTVTFEISNINNLQIALNDKLDKGGYGGTAQELYNYFEGKNTASYNNIPKVGNGASGKVLVSSNISEINGKIGIGLGVEASEMLEINGNIKADNLKAKSTQFQLQSSINPTPNTLVPKTDGSGLVWYDNNSVPKDLGSSGGSGEKLDKFSKIENITVSQDTNYIYIKGDVLHVIKNGEMGSTTPGSAKITLNGYLEITKGILIEKTDTINNPGHNRGVGGFNFMPYDETTYYKGLYIGFYIRIDKSVNPSPFWTNGHGVVCIMLTYGDYVGSSKAIGAIRL